MKYFKATNGISNVSGKKIREFRELEGLSQEILAAKFQIQGVNITQKTISRIETGERLVTDYELMQFSKIFKVPVQDLMKTEYESDIEN